MATATKKTVRRPAKSAEKPTAAADVAATASAATIETATAARDQVDAFFSAFNDNADMMREQTEDMMASLRENAETISARFQTVNADILAAARDEMTEAVDFANELARAKTLGDALEIQRDYWTNLLETRVERARDFAQSSSEAALELAEPLAESAATPFRNNPFAAFFPFAAK